MDTIKEVEFKLDGRIYTAEVRRNKVGDRGWAKSIAYVWEDIADHLDDSMLEKAAEVSKAQSKRTKIGEFPLVDAAYKVHNALVIAIKHRILFTALLHLCDDAAAVGMRFSRKAGCNCGCSPGFVLQGLGRGVSLFIERKKVQEVKRAA